MGRKLEAVIMLRLSDELKAEAEQLAVALDRPVSWVIRHALELLVKAEKEKRDAG